VLLLQSLDQRREYQGSEVARHGFSSWLRANPPAQPGRALFSHVVSVQRHIANESDTISSHAKATLSVIAVCNRATLCPCDPEA
jgi:hypothetical protein